MSFTKSLTLKFDNNLLLAWSYVTNEVLSPGEVKQGSIKIVKNTVCYHN